MVCYNNYVCYTGQPIGRLPTITVITDCFNMYMHLSKRDGNFVPGNYGLIQNGGAAGPGLSLMSVKRLKSLHTLQTERHFLPKHI